MSLLDVAAAFYDRQRAITRAAQLAAHGLWLGLDRDDLDGSWASFADRMLVVVAGAQMLAAQMADAYLDDALAEQDTDPGAEAQVIAAAFAGVASDGRSLGSLLLEALIRTKQTIGQGAPVPEALGRGEASLMRIVGTQVPDAGRAAVGAGIAARPQVTGWTRMLRPPSCGRCAILAGRTYRWSDGFRRHNLCDCTHVPAVEDVPDDVRTDPRGYFESLSRTEQERYFGKRETEAILAGQNMNRVVNAARYTAVAGARPRGRARPTAEQVVADASSRGDAISGLRAAGFVT